MQAELLQGLEWMSLVERETVLLLGRGCSLHSHLTWTMEEELGEGETDPPPLVTQEMASSLAVMAEAAAVKAATATTVTTVSHLTRPLVHHAEA